MTCIDYTFIIFVIKIQAIYLTPQLDLCTFSLPCITGYMAALTTMMLCTHK